MDIKNKYIFKPYNPIFAELFDTEKKRIKNLLGESVDIEHVGSTAVPGLGGKGIIDIVLSFLQNDWPTISEKLKILGYEYKKKDSVTEKERLFFMANLKDAELGTRIYHIHLTYPNSAELRKIVGFRDYLKEHPKEKEEYSKIKELASEEVRGLSTKDEMRDLYSKRKKAFVEGILEKI